MTAAIPLKNGRLHDQTVGAYWEDGFAFPITVFSEAEAAQFRAELEEIEKTWREADLPLPLNTYKRVNSHVVIPLTTRIALDPRVLGVVEGVLGPDLLLWSAEYFIKEPRTSQIVGMHQDLTYWGMGETSDQLTAWIALSPATVESGCMDFVKGSHKNPILPHNDTFSDNNLLSRGQEVAVDVADTDKTHIELRPGQMSLHHGLTIHGSGPNSSDDRRMGLAIRFLNPNVQQKVADRDYAILAQGEDKVGNFTHIPAPTALFAPEALDLYARIRTDQAKALAQGAAEKLHLYSAASPAS